MYYGLIALTGIVFGLGAVLLVRYGNPGNYGFCAACHLRDIAGALGLHQVRTLQYVRPEILGWVLGAFTIAQAQGQFRSRGGSSPLIRFVLGALMILGALVFLGCPLRAILRLSAGDLNGITGLLGFAAGIRLGVEFLTRGFNLGRAHTYSGTGQRLVGYIPAVVAAGLLVAVLARAPFLNFSSSGPGAMHAPVLISLAAGLAAGMLALRTRMCLSGGLRDYLLVRDTYLLKVYAAMFLAAMLGNIYFGYFNLGFTGQPLAHSMHIWNFLGLALTGLTATLAGGCPLRQLIMSGEGNVDAAYCVLGMLFGAGVAHRLNAAASAAGVSMNGQVAVVLGLALAVTIGLVWREKGVTAGRGV